MRQKNRLNNWISIRMGMVIVIFLGVSCGSMKSSTPPPAKDRLTDRQLGEVIAGLPDNSVYLALIAEVGIPVPAAIRDEGL